MKDEIEKSNIQNVDDQLRDLKKRRNNLLKEGQYISKQNYRKERAHRLIQTGALAEKYFELKGLTIEEREELYKTFAMFVTSNKPKKFRKK